MEWKEVLALRRVYYLEADHYQQRKIDLSMTTTTNTSTVNNHTHNLTPRNNDTTSHLHQRRFFRDSKGGASAAASERRRDPWVPNPESRDTVPNIELYSVLVSGIPSLPSKVVDVGNNSDNINTDNNNDHNGIPITGRASLDNTSDVEHAVNMLTQEHVDWQLAITTAFFEHAVPRQPGFTSSVAAVTILPDADELATAWRKWYIAAAVLRRLRFVRSLIADRRDYNGELNLNLSME